ncbi:hypothetical protein [Deinococcus sp. ME38]|uniref:hypothetical protein n=1 Tax=Deinococcus sp. ME38 TaxID=3400344 RepID=UPI003B5AE96D
MEYIIIGKANLTPLSHTILLDNYDSEQEVIQLSSSESTFSMKLYDEADIIDKLGPYIKSITIDITHLDIAIWAPVVRALIYAEVDFYVDYYSPDRYNCNTYQSLFGDVDAIELSTKISPISGFANLNDDEDPFIFIPIVGFQGSRYQYISNNLEPQQELTIPIVSLPERRIEYFRHTLLSNKATLLKDMSWRKIAHYGINDCRNLAEFMFNLGQKNPDKRIKIALIGPRLQCLSAVICASLYCDRFQLIYDHPMIISPEEKKIRSRKRINVKEIVDAIR